MDSLTSQTAENVSCAVVSGDLVNNLGWLEDAPGDVDNGERGEPLEKVSLLVVLVTSLDNEDVDEDDDDNNDNDGN